MDREPKHVTLPREVPEETEAACASRPRDRQPPRFWTAEEDGRLRDLHLAHAAVREMAVLFDREESAIRRRLSTLGLMSRPIARIGAHLTRRSNRRLH